MSRLAWTHLELLEALGEGHSGVVFRARLRKATADLAEGTFVAVKRYKSWVMEEHGQLDRIFGEVDVGRRVTHPNVAQVFGGILDDAGRPALVMQYCEGQTLETALHECAEFERMSLEDRFSILSGIAGGIAALHDCGIIHRDVKPANIILTAGGPVLTDFGVVKSSSFAQQTTAGAFLGTIRYAAPEYIFGEDSDRRLDVYGFGGIAYEVLTGRELYGSERHWARLVAAKAKNPGLTSVEWRSIPTSYGWNVASLIQYVLAHSLCGQPKRDLDLNSLAKGLAQRLWLAPFATTDGHVSTGDKLFGGSYATARSAATAMTKYLSTEDRRQIDSLLTRDFFEPWIRVRDMRKKRLERYLSHRFAQYTSAKRGAGTVYIRFEPAVREAFALGLIDLEPDVSGDVYADTD